MPKRAERLFWIKASRLDPGLASRVLAQLREAVQSWSDCGIEVHSCVASNAPNDWLWLARLATQERRVARVFNKRLSEVLAALPSKLEAPALKLKRQVNLPTPLVRPRLSEWPTTDIGLHSVNDDYNAMLVTFSYYEGRYYNPPHMQLNVLASLHKRVHDVWSQVACDCFKRARHTCEVGCYDCFDADCPQCSGTGWREFARWRDGGYRVDYTGAAPLAIAPGAG